MGVRGRFIDANILMATRIPYVLTVSGSDSSGCAGLQADNRAIHAVGAMPLNVVTASTLQTPAGVLELGLADPAVVAKHLRSLLEAYPVKAIKIGMLGSASLVEVLAQVLADFPDPFVVLDPVIRSSSGHDLLDSLGVATLNAQLMPHVDLVTPNLAEQIDILPGEHSSVLIKGGHAEGPICTDVLILPDGSSQEFSSERVDTLNLRGTGCVLSAAIAAYIAKGKTLEEAVRAGKRLLQRALECGVENVFHGGGPSFIEPAN